jgi:hypothetical protein
MEYIIFLYIFFTGCIYTSWLWDLKEPFWFNFLNIFIGFVNGWYITPILIGRVIKQIYKD